MSLLENCLSWMRVFAGNTGIGRWPCHLPAKLREQPDGRLPDKLVFGVGVGHENQFLICVPRRHTFGACLQH